MKSVRNLVFFFGIFFFLIMIFSCRDTQSKGFALPEGDVNDGRAAFIALSCNNCHNIGTIQWNGDESKGDLHIALGGKVSKIKTYGELVTSVINPNHKIARKYRDEVTTFSGQSRMKRYNSVMTVQELVDIVTFLQEEYDVVTPEMPYYYY